MRSLTLVLWSVPGSPLISSHSVHSVIRIYSLAYMFSSPVDSRDDICVSICRFLCLYLCTCLHRFNSVHHWMCVQWDTIAFHWRALDHQKNIRAIFSSGAIMVTFASSRAQPCGQLTSFCLNAIGRQQFFCSLNNNAKPCFSLVSQ